MPELTTPSRARFDAGADRSTSRDVATTAAALAAEPEALRWATDTCTIQRAVETIGDRWSLLVLRELFSGIRRFDQLTVRTAIPRQVLTDRLARLTESGIVRREPYREPGQRQRYEYRLTEKGLDLYPVLMALAAWGDRYLADPEGPPIEFVHRGCGEPVELVVRCAAGHEPGTSREIGGRPGPGAHRRTA
jgi:DNA-binding HxlR family transcriptional regulator